MLLELLLLVHDLVLVILPLVLLMLFPREILMIFLMITLVLFLKFKNASFNEFCLKHGVGQQFSTPRIPQ
jgi:hypothetical protein